MLRSEIQRKTGLTRKAIEYYEDKGLIEPKKSKNGYRDYSEKDLDILNKISLFRRIGLNLAEIENILSSDGNKLSSILRKKQYQLEIEEKRKEILELIIKDEDREIINEKIKLIEVEESIYERLESAFPGYFGQMMFSAYQPFLNERLDKKGQEAFDNYIKYLDTLPNFILTKEEEEYIEKVSSSFDKSRLSEVNIKKIEAIEDIEAWLRDNKDTISEYEKFKNSDEYQNSQIKKIQDKLQGYMIENRYYEIAIPLIRQFSKGYDEYYIKLLEANKIYLDEKRE